MRAAIFLLLLTACYTEVDAVDQLRKLDRPEPIQCARLSQSGGTVYSFACTDGQNVSWVCQEEGCFRWSK